MTNTGVVGLNNLGNTCYMNASLQCLRCVLKLNMHIAKVTESGTFQTNNAIVDKYFSFVKKVWTTDKPTVSPMDLKMTLNGTKFHGYAQHDAQEFTNYLLDTLHENLKRKEDKKSIISDTFFGQYKSTVICALCNYESITYEDFMFLTLPVTKDFRDSLKQFIGAETLDSQNQYKCDKCHEKSLASKQMIIHKLSDVLIVHLKRFNAFRKIDDYMEIPFEFCDDDENNYHLFGVVNHYGNFFGGHYTANIKLNNVWYDMNDSSFRQINPDAVLTNAAYILYYQRENKRENK